MASDEMIKAYDIDSHVQNILNLQKRADFLAKELANTMLEIEGLNSLKDKTDE